MKTIFIPLMALFFLGCQSDKLKKANVINKKQVTMDLKKGNEVAIFAGGCFWCTEAVFLELDGVQSVKPGYIGGTIPNPSYDDVCSGYSGHAEAIQIVFDPAKITYGELLEVFFATHDPTTVNRQGADVGTQYRSEVFATNAQQKELALTYIQLLNAQNTYGKLVVTKVSDAPEFYIAEDYHQNYYNQNKEKSYCSYVITPKVDKVRELFKDKLKK
ncbi:peptide-methionine (S)-S-oxide reductase MsrA [Flavobacterium humi]|uniref:Peptide methionine sulfoxide reductase MsrA n=1 Tax=Flavobacterium humi TaxID=2562683 RepID=A0A4Z0LBY9_9FLAO|nr:peptide-methionine (S)-S-oxide reductase MsrA [Flavobacterium humi]